MTDAQHLTAQLKKVHIEGRVIEKDGSWWFCTPHPFQTQQEQIGASYAAARAFVQHRFGLVLAQPIPPTDERRAWIRQRRADLKAHYEMEGVEFDARLRRLKGQVLPWHQQAAVDEYDALGAEDDARIEEA